MIETILDLCFSVQILPVNQQNMIEYRRMIETNFQVHLVDYKIKTRTFSLIFHIETDTRASLAIGLFRYRTNSQATARVNERPVC